LIATKGAHVTIFARREGPLEEARKEILAARIDDAQEINTVSLDATDASQVS
jgi:3-dehydrosphinganine reductase